MPNKYIALDRTFSPLFQYDEPDGIDENHLDWESFWESPLTEVVGWDGLIQEEKIVILAEAGTGKTEELKAIAKKLYKQGKPAFFLRLELLLESDFQISDYLNSDQQGCFQGWLESEDDEFIAYFFLDSVDEAKLQQSSALEIILSRFVRGIGSENLSRAKIFMTSRFSEWRVESDLSVFKERLIPPSLGSSAGQTPQSENKAQPKIVYRLNPLSDEQIKNFAQQADLIDPEQFINKIHQADAISFAQRPQDLIDLIVYWKDHEQKLPERYIDLVQFNIKKKLSEPDGSRAQQSSLSYQDAYSGAQLLAAATTLCKRNTIRLSETVKDDGVRQLTIEASSVMPHDWVPSKLSALITLPIFDPEIYGAIRFHHRSAREFLTAHWFYQILECTPLARKSVNELLFAKTYGHSVVIPSMQPIAAWLSCWDTKTRNKLVAIAPEVLIEYGDPSVFPVEFRIKLLNILVKHYHEKKRTDLQVESSVLKRLASNDPEMVAVINSKLKHHSKNEDLCRLFLEIVRQGKLASCSPALASLAKDQKNSERVRVIAFRSILELGEVSLQKKVIMALFDQGAEGRKIVSWECSYLFPKNITSAEMIAIISDSPLQGRRPLPELSYQFEVLAASANQWDKDVTIQLLIDIYGLVKQEPFIEDVEYGVSSNYAWLLVYAVQFASSLIEKQDVFCFDPVVLEIFWLFSQRKNSGVFDSHIRDVDVLEAARGWHDFSYKLFWYAVDASLARNIQPFGWEYVFNYHYVIWQPQLSDWERLIYELVNRHSQSEKRIALTALYKIYIDSGCSNEQLAELRDVIGESSDLRLELESRVNPPEQSIVDASFADNQDVRSIRRSEREEQYRKDVEVLRADPASFQELYTPETGFHPATDFLYSSLRNAHQNGSMQKSFSEWQLLEPEFGATVAETFRDGCIKLWRDFDPTTLDKWREVNYEVLGFGLTGLAMESVHIPNWISYLSSADATRAATYATQEMNSFPDWISSLQQAFPQEIKAVFLEQIRYELFNNDTSYAENLGRLRNNSQGFNVGVFLPDLINLLEATEQTYNSKAAKCALNIIIENEPSAETKNETQRRLSRIAVRFYQTNETNQERLFWLHILFAVDAGWALRLLNESVDQLGEYPEQKKQWVESVFAQFSYEGRHRVYSPYFQDYTRTEILEKLVPLAYTLIKEEDDIKRESGPYTPTDRDDAQSVRFRLLDKVAKTPGKQSHDLLVKWAGEPLFASAKDWLLNQAKRRAEEDSELEAWKEEEVLAFTEKYNDYKDKTVHKLLKSIVDNPWTSAGTIATIIGAIAAVVSLFGSTPPSQTNTTNNNITNSTITNSTIQQGNKNSNVTGIENTLRDFDKESGSADELKKYLQTYEKIIESDPENIEAYNYIGRIQMSVGNPYAAVEAFGKVLSIAKEEGAVNWQGVAYSNLGLANQKRNNIEVACVNWQDSLIFLDSKQSADRVYSVQKMLSENCVK